MKIKFNWGTGIAVFLVLFVLLAFYFIYFSFQHHNDLVVDDYYEQGANYDEQMLINKRSYPFTDSIKVENGDSFVTLTIAPSIAQMTDSIQAHFYFPSDKRNDYKVSIYDFGNTTRVDKNFLSKGRYILKFSWYSGDEKYMTSQDFYVSK